MLTTRTAPPRRDDGRTRAFTLIELIVVIVIVAVLVGIAAVGYTSVINHSHNTKTEVSLRQLHKMAMATAAAEQRPVTLADFQNAAPEVPTLAALGRSGQPLAAGTPDVEQDGAKAVTAGVVLVSIDTTNPNIVGLATKSTTGDCVTLSGNSLNATTMIGGSDCTGGAALTIAQTQAQLPTPTGTTGTPTSSPTTSATTSPTTTTTSTTTTPSPTTTTITTPAPDPTNAPSAMSFSVRAGLLGSSGWSATAYGAGTYIAASGTQVATSTDGVTWSVQTIPRGSVNIPVAAAYGNGRFVIMFDNGYARWSTDAITWTTVVSSLPYARSLYFANGKFFAIQETNYGSAASSDGATWTKGTANLMSKNCVVGGGGLWVMPPGADNFIPAKTATDPVGTWTSNSGLATGYTTYPQANCAYGNGRFVIGASNASRVYGSSNGTTWDTTTTFSPSTVAFLNGEFIALSTTNVWTSVDGKAWSSKATGSTVSGYKSCTSGSPRLVCVDANGGVFLGQ